MRADGGDMHIYQPNGGPLLDQMQCPGAHECSNFGPITWGRHYRGMTNDQLSNMPVMSSEIGCDLGRPGCGPNLQAKLHLRILADALVANNFERAYIYAIRDCCGMTYGLFDGTGNPCPAAINISNFTAILGRNDSSDFTPTAVDVTVKGLATDGRYKLLQHSNGSYRLLIWNERSARTGGVMVSFGSTSTVAPKRFDPTLGTDAQTTGSVGSASMTLIVTDYPQVVEFKTAGPQRDMKAGASR